MFYKIFMLNGFYPVANISCDLAKNSMLFHNFWTVFSYTWCVKLQSQQTSVLPATVPASALAVVPRVSTPVPHHSIPQSRSLPLPDSSPEDTDSSLPDYQQARNTASWVQFQIIAAADCAWLLIQLSCLIFFCSHIQ